MGRTSENGRHRARLRRTFSNNMKYRFSNVLHKLIWGELIRVASEEQRQRDEHLIGFFGLPFSRSGYYVFGYEQIVPMDPASCLKIDLLKDTSSHAKTRINHKDTYWKYTLGLLILKSELLPKGPRLIGLMQNYPMSSQSRIETASSTCQPKVPQCGPSSLKRLLNNARSIAATPLGLLSSSVVAW